MSENIKIRVVNKPIVNDILVGDSTITVIGEPEQRATVIFQNGVSIGGLITETGSVELIIPKYIKMTEGTKVKVRLKEGYKQSEFLEVEIKPHVNSNVDVKEKEAVKKRRSNYNSKKVELPKINISNLKIPKIKLKKVKINSKKLNLKAIQLAVIAFLSILIIVLLTTKLSAVSDVNSIEKIGYTQEEAKVLYDSCENKNQCAKSLEEDVEAEIKSIEDSILASFQLETVNYDANYQRSNYTSQIAYKNALIEYQQILTSQIPVSEVEQVSFTPDENGCYVNMVNGYVVANKKYCLPSDYDPGTNQEAYDQLLKMINDANAQGISISIISGYRSYDEQAETYDYWANLYGEEYSSTISAKPGYSEHQTGLAFDLGDKNNPYCDLEECFESTEAGIWLAQHAHEYGFIIRYPKGKESITGYAYEPWHFRYVGDIATDIYEQQITLEEYLQVP